MPKYDLPEDDIQNHNGAKFVVVGVGGGGGNAVDYMVKKNIADVTFVAVNTDAQALENLTVPHKFALGVEGLGVGGDPERGREYAEGQEEDIRSFLSGHNMVFITAGMGGGTGTGAAPVIARIAKEMGILTVAVVTTPFRFEAARRMNIAKQGIAELLQCVDSIITVPNEKLLEIYSNIGMRDAFSKADDVLLNAVQGIIGVVRDGGQMNVDFRDVEATMRARGYAMMGIGRASGENRAQQAVERAIKSPLLDNLRLENAQGAIICVKTNSNTPLSEINEIEFQLGSLVNLEDPDANVFWGFVYDDDMGDELQVTIVATGLQLDGSAPVRRPVVSVQQTQSIPQQAPAVNSPSSQPMNKIGTDKFDVNAFLRQEHR